MGTVIALLDESYETLIRELAKKLPQDRQGLAVVWKVNKDNVHIPANLYIRRNIDRQDLIGIKVFKLFKTIFRERSAIRLNNRSRENIAFFCCRLQPNTSGVESLRRYGTLRERLSQNTRNMFSAERARVSQCRTSGRAGFRAFLDRLRHGRRDRE